MAKAACRAVGIAAELALTPVLHPRRADYQIIALLEKRDLMMEWSSITAFGALLPEKNVSAAWRMFSATSTLKTAHAAGISSSV
jgi:hypothetical protein